MKRTVSLFFKGAGMGAADAVPGVSGGTIAFVTGIYEELIDTIRRFGPDARPSRERDRGRKSRGGHGRRRHEDAGNDRGRRGGSRFDDYDY